MYTKEQIVSKIKDWTWSTLGWPEIRYLDEDELDKYDPDNPKTFPITEKMEQELAEIKRITIDYINEHYNDLSQLSPHTVIAETILDKVGLQIDKLGSYALIDAPAREHFIYEINDLFEPELFWTDPILDDKE